MSGQRILLWVQHLIGIGHVRRAALIAEALAAEGFAVTVARGGFPVPGISFGTATIVQLPPCRTADDSFTKLLDEAGRPVDADWQARRAALLMQLFREVRPDALLLESFPLGRRAFGFELKPVLEAARAAEPRPLVASLVRDILVAKHAPDKYADMADMAERWVDLVLVHGDPAILPLDATFPPIERIRDRVRYTGYVAPRPAHSQPGTDGEDEVIVSVGGGGMGEGALLRVAMAARRAGALADATWRFLVGASLPDALLAELRSAAPAATPAATVVERARPDFPALLARCRLSISQAGYNTVMDVLSAGCRALLVPHTGGGQTEQALRARLLAERGLVRQIADRDVTAERLAAAVTAAAAMTPPSPHAARATVAMDGAPRTARLIAAALGQRRGPTAPHAAIPDRRADPWDALSRELDRWAEAGRRATFWWRDDDAVDATPALRRLLDLLATHRVPLGLAVIPARASPELASELAAASAARSDLFVLQHGWSHANHAAPERKKAELGDDRAPAAIAAELQQGRRIVETLFGTTALPVLVPPWNRIGAPVKAMLPALGFRGISAFGPRAAPAPATLREVNTHADPIDWRQGRRFAGSPAALNAVIGHLTARRQGRADPAEATGLLTHHLIHDGECWDFLDLFLARTRHHPAVTWESPITLFAPDHDPDHDGAPLSA